MTRGLPFRIFALILFTAGLALAQSPEFSSKSDAFERGLKSRDQAKRLAGCGELEGVREPQAAPLLAKWIGRIGEDTSKRRDRIERDEAEIAEELHKRVEKPRMTEAKRQEARTLVEKQLAPLREKVEENRKAVEENAEVVERLGDLLRELFGGLEAADLEKAAEYLVRDLRGTRDAEQLVQLLQAAGSAPHPLVVSTLAEFVDRSRFPSVRVASLDALAHHPCEEAGRAGAEALDDEYFQVRFAALLMLREVGGREAIPPLITRLDEEKGRLEDEVVKTLQAITNAAFGANRQRWSDWWKEHGEAYEGRGPGAGAKGYRIPDSIAKRMREEEENRRKGRGAGAGNSFYGIQTKARHIMYILDVSGSMNADAKGNENGKVGERRIDQAVAELKKSIGSIPAGGTFNIIFYNEKVDIWRKDMQPASEANKKEACSWADAVAATGRTNIFDSLDLAFQVAGRGAFDKYYKVAIETIFLLSDGSPNEGRIIETEPMLAEVRKLNALSKIQIHTIGLGGGGMGGLLQRLAQQNNGEFVNIR
ncbi:MAG: HEAT repeat domain-containing protein [Planctomycetota bacterium]